MKQHAAGSQRSEVRGQRTDGRRQMTELRIVDFEMFDGFKDFNDQPFTVYDLNCFNDFYELL